MNSATSYMQHNAEDLSCYLEANDCMEDYLVRSDMQSPSVWATEQEIFAAAYMHASNAYICIQQIWTQVQGLQFSPVSEDISATEHSKEAIFLINISNHYETVRRM